jgi:hypothetical protein
VAEPGSVDHSWLGESRIRSHGVNPDFGYAVINGTAGQQLRLDLGESLSESLDHFESADPEQPQSSWQDSLLLPGTPLPETSSNEPSQSAPIPDPSSEAASASGLPSPTKSGSRGPSQKQQQKLLLAELEQLRSLTHKQVERIHHLEQALDQSLAFQEELRIQLRNQAFLENQLAATEEIANIQQQAITQLKRQLAQQQEILEHPTICEGLEGSGQSENSGKSESPEKPELSGKPESKIFEAILQDIEILTQGQQTKVELLRTQIHRDRAAVKTQKDHLSRWFTDFQTTMATQQQRFSELGQSVSPQSGSDRPNENPQETQAAVQDLSQKLTERDASIHQLETELHRAHIALLEQQAVIDGLKAFSVKHFGDNPALGTELFTAQCKIQELETQVSKQTTSQAMLQHACQELEQARERHQSRIVELENLVAEMQEQILGQAQQASEYETAVQHWKNRYLNSAAYLSELKQLLDQELPTPSDELAELMAAIQMAPVDGPDASSPVPNPRKIHPDVPDFLMRRQRHRVRS